MVEPGDLKELTNQAGEAAYAELSALITQLLGDFDDGPETHAADVGQLAEVGNDVAESLGDAGLTLLFEVSGAFSVHAAGYMQDDVIPNLGALDGHDGLRVPQAGVSVNGIDG